MAKFDPKMSVRVEIELVFERNAAKAKPMRDATEASIAKLGGRKLDQARLEQIAYDALLIEVSAANAQAIAQRDPASFPDCPMSMPSDRKAKSTLPPNSAIPKRRPRGSLHPLSRQLRQFSMVCPSPITPPLRSTSNWLIPTTSRLRLSGSVGTVPR